MAAHFQHENRQRQGQPDPEPAGHVRAVRGWAALPAATERLQRHAADRAIAWPVLPDLRVHRAGVDRACGHLLRPARFRAQIFRGIGDEFGAAAGRAEEITLPVMLGLVGRLKRIDHHPANRVLDRLRQGLRKRWRAVATAATAMSSGRGVVGMIFHDF